LDMGDAADTIKKVIKNNCRYSFDSTTTSRFISGLQPFYLFCMKSSQALLQKFISFEILSLFIKYRLDFMNICAKLALLT
jgi:hypothetical protein